ncbi:MAG: CPP1-like family protein [Cyanobacteriota bacterium]
MNQGTDQPPSPGDDTPYSRLGVQINASFDAVQAARQARLADVGDDPMARARIEAAYDAVLMERLKERQQGRVSTAAASASQREQTNQGVGRTTPLPVLPQVSLPKLPVPALAAPSLALGQGRSLWLPAVAFPALLLALLLLPGLSAEVVLAVATLMTAVCLLWRGRRLPTAAGLAFAFLMVGLVLGGLLTSVLDPHLPLGLPLNSQQIQGLPSLLLLALAALLLI